LAFPSVFLLLVCTGEAQISMFELPELAGPAASG
jgi:hypothetical protein